MKKIILLLTTLLLSLSVDAQGIEEVGATVTILPATRYTQEQWTVPAYNLRLGNTVEWGEDYPVLGTPPADRNGRQWYEPNYQLTNGDANWVNATAPFSSNRWYNGMPSTRWASDYEPADLYFRRTFKTDVSLKANIYLACGYDDSPCEYYLNGTLIFSSDYGWNENAYMQMTASQKALIYNDGRDNIIAVHIHNNYGGSYADVGLYACPYEDSDDDADFASSLIINEVSVANIDQVIDYSFNYGAWIELYNKSDKRISLENLYVSDDPEHLDKFMLPHAYGVIAPNSYKNIYFDHNAAKGTYGITANKQVNFKLNTEGGTVYLSADGVTAFASVTYPAAIARCSYARKSLTSDEWEYNGEPTPEAANANAFATARLEAPVVDTDSRLFDSPFSVRVKIPQGTTLRYTKDGTAPTASSNISSTGLFNISETTSLRLRLFKEGQLPSQVVTRSYIYRDRNYYLPVVSITTNPDNLYDNTIGVYVDGTNGVEGRNHGKSNINMDWERPVNFEYITADGKMGVNQEAEFTISGGWSRHYGPASFKIKASKVYEGINSIDYPMFPLKPYNKYKQILIRNGGNDNDSWQHGRVRDAITQNILMSSGFYIDAQDYQPVHVFFNGHYIGQLNLREPNNRYNGTANYGYDDDEMDAFEYSNGYFQMAGTKDAFNEWVNVSETAAEDASYQKLRKMVDMDEVINYFASISYIGCSDWICNNNNSKGYRSLPDGKFHLTLLDQDWGWSNIDGVSRLEGQTYNELLKIYNQMKQNPEFQRQFVDTYCILNGSVFTPERCQAINDSICALVAPALAFEGKQPYTSANEQLGNMTSQGARSTRIQALRDSYNLNNGMTVDFFANIPEASFRINGLSVPTNRFSGKLFAPVAIETSAPSGYLFKGWKTKINERVEAIARETKWYYYDQGSLDSNPDWKTASFSSWKNGNAPLGYGKSDIATTISYGDDANNKYVTYYFRRNLFLEDEVKGDETFTLNFTADDGFVFYVNGVEAARYNMPEGEITYDTFAPTFAVDNPDSGTLTLPASLFKKGTNKLAVEVHNNVPGSSDIYWDAAITIERITDDNIVSTDRVLQLDEDESMSLIAVYEPLDDEYLAIAGQTPVVINEVSAANTIYVNDYYKRNDWIELYNTTNEDIDVAGMYLSDNPEKPLKFQISAGDTEAGTIIPAHGYLIVWADKLDPIFQLHSSFKLGNNDGESITITAQDESWSNTLEYMSHTGEETVGRYPDGGSRIYKMTRPTIGAANQLTTYAEWISGENADFDLEGYLADIEHITLDDAAKGTMQFFTIDGIRLNGPQRGINIVRYADGTTRKIVVKN